MQNSDSVHSRGPTALNSCLSTIEEAGNDDSKPSVGWWRASSDNSAHTPKANSPSMPSNSSSASSAWQKARNITNLSMEAVSTVVDKAKSQAKSPLNVARNVSMSAMPSTPLAVKNAAASATNSAMRTSRAGFVTVTSAVASIPVATRNIVDTISDNMIESIDSFFDMPGRQTTTSFFGDVGSGGPPIAARRLNPNTKPYASDFRQRLEFLLSTEDTAKEVAKKLYPRFSGDADKLDMVAKLLEQKWCFPPQVFPALHNQIRKAAGQADTPSHITEAQWEEAFLKWLQALRASSSLTKVSRKCLVHSRPGSFLKEEYLQGAKLGEGSFGEVHLMLHKALGVARVFKSVPKSQLGVASENVEDEVNLLKSMDHPNIIRIFETFETDECLHIVMDYAEGGDLRSVIRQVQMEEKLLPNDWVRSATGQIRSALQYMHKRAVIHCDLKPANAMMLFPFNRDKLPHVLIADFGLAEIFKERPDHGAVTVKGTPSYLAPEGFEGHLTQKSDMWALGVIIYELVLGQKPFIESKNVFVLWTHIAKKEPDLEKLPTSARDAVKALLDKDPQTRPSASDCLSLEWFQFGQELTTPTDRQLPLGHLTYFHRACMFCIASGLSMKDMNELYTIFHMLDKDKSGSLDVKELQQGLHVLGIHEDPSTLLSIMDMDQNGSIEYTEFIAAALKIDADLNDRLVEYAFEMFDLDADGYISAHELQHMLSGDGPLVDILPDGQTLEQVMNKLSNGAQQITFEDFREYLQDASPYQQGSCKSHANRDVERGETSPRFVKIDRISQVFEQLDEVENEPDRERSGEDTIDPQFPDFLQWLADLKEEPEDNHKEQFTRFLRFVDYDSEAWYVAQDLPCTCRNMALFAFIVMLGSILSLFCNSDFTWSPTLTSWGHASVAVYNCTFILAAGSALVVIVLCVINSGKWRRRKVHNDGALHLEIGLCVWATLVPTLVCFFGNRFYVAKFFNEDPLEAFPSASSDDDPLLGLLAMCIFVTSRTRIRFVCVFWWYSISLFAYVISSATLAPEPSWTAYYAITLCLLVFWLLEGHHSAEYHRRVTFLSLYHSYVALEALQAESPDEFDILQTAQSKPVDSASGSQMKRFKAALDLIQAFSETKDLSCRPLRSALRSLKEVLETIRDDIAWANRWVSLDHRASVIAETKPGLARDSLFALFDVHESVTPEKETLESTFSPREAEPVYMVTKTVTEGAAAAALPEWGWDTLRASGHPLVQVGWDILLPTVKTLGTADAEFRGHGILEGLLREYSRNGVRSAEARAALCVRSAHWLAQAVGLWSKLEPWEQSALLISAAALHCQSPGGGAVTYETMLTRVTCTSYLMDLLDKVGMVTDANAYAFRQLVCRVMIRATPRKMLEDARLIRCQANQCGRLAASEADRMVLISLLVATADFSFLVLPTPLHKMWASVCQAELRVPMASTVKAGTQAFDVASWLHALIEIIMDPVFETLSVLDGVDQNLDDPKMCLRANDLMWGGSKLIVDVGRPAQHSEVVDEIVLPGQVEKVEGP